jgi:hypothetical protein
MSKNEASATKEVNSSRTNQLPNPKNIAVRAYEIFLERGATPGRELEDWLQAEVELAKK